MPTSFLDWLALATIIIMGGFAIFGIWDREKQKKDKANDDADDRLIELLKGTVDSLERQVQQLQNQVKELENSVYRLSSENKILRGLLDGKDDNTQKLRAEAVVAMEKVSQIFEMSVVSSQNTEKLYKLLEEHLQKIERK